MTTSATTGSTKTATPLASSDPGYTRLHISPLDADLLSVIVPGSVRPDARNISYHGLQAFPEKRYGYVDLPSAAADKLRNKLNGAVLKGVKLRIQPARIRKTEEDAWAPRKQSDSDDDSSMAGSHRSKKGGPRGRRENKDFMQSATFGLTTWRRLGGAAASEEIPGIQLEAGRQVKRGWTEGEDDKIARKKAKKAERNSSRGQKDADKPKTDHKMRQRAAKYTDKKECLMKTILPPKAMAAEKAAAAAAAPAAAAVAPAEEDEETRARRRKRDKRARHVVVHEFAHSTKFPTFLRSAGDAAAPSRAHLEYVAGKGWVDGTGDVVEAMLSTRPAVVTAKIDTEAMKAKIEKARKAQIASSDDSSETSDSGDSTSSSGESEEEEADEEEEAEEEDGEENKKKEAPPMAERPKSSGSSKGLTIKIPPAVAVHPLEALYKKTKPTSGDDKTKGVVDADKPAAEPFSFFGGSADVDNVDDADDDGEPQPTQPPMTPYTERELEWRNVRSAAPTPDTAHPSRSGSMRWPFGDRMEEDADDDDDDDDDRKAGAKDKEAAATDDPTADFETWFWDNRGDLNRSWKKRRKTAAKEKRYRDNKARAGRAI